MRARSGPVGVMWLLASGVASAGAGAGAFSAPYAGSARKTARVREVAPGRVGSYSPLPLRLFTGGQVQQISRWLGIPPR